jgi:hypothetical protein
LPEQFDKSYDLSQKFEKSQPAGRFFIYLEDVISAGGCSPQAVEVLGLVDIGIAPT